MHRVSAFFVAALFFFGSFPGTLDAEQPQDASSAAATSVSASSASVEAELNQGGEALVRGDLDKARRHFLAARKAAPEQPLVHLGLGEIALRREENAAALEHARTARRLDSPQPSIALATARLLVRLAPVDEALEALSRAADVMPGSAEPHLLAALLARDHDRIDEAVASFENALRRDVEDPGGVRLEIAAMLLDAERPQQALTQLSEAKKLLPQTPEVYYRLAAAHRALGDAEAARAALERFQELEKQREAAEQASREIGMALNEAQELAGENRLDEALARVDDLLRQFPPTTRVLILRAKILFSLGRVDDALKDVVQARDLSPERVEPHYLEGLFAAQTDPQRARLALGRALEIAPDLAEARALLERMDEP